MKAYIIAVTSGGYMFPVFSKIYKSKLAAEKACKKYNDNLTGNLSSKAVVLVADNWHVED